ncbi:ABC transporter substrate-binding protein [Chlorogloeopsis sp. ULAP01]|uniref:ABC transporter substrate-binding protein n=1 Tax=Chlorogloeopsis sp. ULAP01 TaxID=3056483 RepID=UPI0025AAD85A|nr:ABC transporter substrate-binding protein [Chlorogloeopsis sp. ULAP01]MDM9380759.1 ABC transporter substrate-binding protein [Chlorogloeopsis sp. ULAP01]
MKKNFFNFLLLAVAIALLAISCQQIQTHRAATKPAPVTVKLSGWGSDPIEQKLLKQVLKDFEAQHPGIKVRYEVISDQYMDVIKTRLVGEAAPDVFYLDALEAPFLMSQNVLEPLDAYITSDFDLSDFEENLINSFKYDHQIYGLPKDYSTLTLFYNKKAFTAVGLTSPPKTWDELRTYSKQLTTDKNQDGRIDQYGYGVIPELARQAYKIGAFGGQLVDENGYATFASAAGLKGLQLVVEQYQKERSSAQKSDVGTNSGSEMFGQGKVAMVIEGNWAIPFLKETFPQLEFATAEVPSINNKKGTMVFTVAYVMNKQSQHKSEAWQLISYLTGKEGMEKWTGTGFALPTRKSIGQKLGYDKDPLRSPFLAGVDYAMPWQAGKYPAAIMNSFDNQFVSALLGQQPLQQAMQRAQQEANKLIKAME